MGCAVIASKFGTMMPSLTSCQPVDRAHSVGLAWEDHCFLRRSAGHPPRTCCASCRHVLQQPKFSSFAVMCLLRTRVTKMLHCGLLSRATKRPHPKITVFHRFALAGFATDVTRYRTSTHTSYSAAVRAFSAMMTRDMSSARGTAWRSWTLPMQAHLGVAPCSSRNLGTWEWLQVHFAGTRPRAQKHGEEAYPCSVSSSACLSGRSGRLSDWKGIGKLGASWSPASQLRQPSNVGRGIEAFI